MKFFIIGNGFDIGHNLDTRYWDFRKFLEYNYTDFLRSFEQHYDIYPGIINKVKQELLWNEFEKNLANINEETIIELGREINLNLESGDIGIEDTLYDYFNSEYQHIEKLAIYLKEWIRTIRIHDCKPKTTFINKNNNDIYLTFNYTSVLENVYGISNERVIHIHGSLKKYKLGPIIGHGNIERIKNIKERIIESEKIFDEKSCSICRVLENYYVNTYKDIKKYYHLLSDIEWNNVNEVVVIGHSMSDIDLPYFSFVDEHLRHRIPWIIYCFKEAEMDSKTNNLIKVGIEVGCIKTLLVDKFYNL